MLTRLNLVKADLKDKGDFKDFSTMTEKDGRIQECIGTQDDRLVMVMQLSKKDFNKKQQPFVFFKKMVGIPEQYIVYIDFYLGQQQTQTYNKQYK